MRIAITADLHLTTRRDHPERFEVLQDILRQCGELGVDQLIIAGDLFDQSRQNFADFERAYREARPAGLPVMVIPGNHDADLTGAALAVEGVEVISEAELRSAGERFELLLVPYKPDTSMAEHLPPFRQRLTAGRWALIGHGDWLPGRRSPDPNEPGVYMPLTRTDLTTYQPAAALLGHIHAPYDQRPVHAPGSPCPLDITETGLRRFLIFDTEARVVAPQRVDSPRLYFDERVIMLPVEDEAAYLKEQLERRVRSWGLPEGWEDRVQVRLRIAGYVTDRAAAEAGARKAMSPFSFYDDGPDLSELEHAVDLDRIHIAREVREWVDELDWPLSAAEPTRQDITLEALRVIWGA